MKATQRLIDSVWTLEYTIQDDGKIFIINYNRNDVEGYEQEKNLPRMSLKENEGRIVEGVYLQPYESFKYWASKDLSAFYEVANPKHVFSYNNETV